MFTAWYGLIAYIKQITFSAILLNFKIVTFQGLRNCVSCQPWGNFEMSVLPCVRKLWLIRLQV